MIERSLLLRHASRDEKEVRILRAGATVVQENGRQVRRAFLELHWPLCGYYTLDLDRNIILRATLWTAADIDEAWRQYHELAGNKFKKLPTFR